MISGLAWVFYVGSGILQILGWKLGIYIGIFYMFIEFFAFPIGTALAGLKIYTYFLIDDNEG